MVVVVDCYSVVAIESYSQVGSNIHSLDKFDAVFPMHAELQFRVLKIGHRYLL